MVAPGVDVKRCAAPDGGEEAFILCRSEGRKAKEQAILNRFVERLEAALNKMVSQAEQGKLRNRQTVERRIGRLLERNRRAASLFEIRVEEHGSGQDVRVRIQVQKDHTRYAWALTTSGAICCAPTGARGPPRTYGRPICN